MKRLALAAVLLACTALTAPASADALLTLSATPTGVQQSESNPCIIAGTTCPHQGSLGYNLYSPNNDSSYNRTSNNTVANVPDGQTGTSYNALALVLAAGGVTFDIAIDVNTTNDTSERLRLFQVIDTTTNTVLYHYGDGSAPSCPSSIACIGLGDNNGNGYSDFILHGITLTGIGVQPTDGILFKAFWDGAVDGTESFFIANGSGGTVINPQCTGNTCAVPGPIVGAGIPGLVAACMTMLGFNYRRRRRNAA